MLALLVAVIFGAAVGYFATQNTTPVTIRFAEYALEEVPLYLVVVGSLLMGLLIAWILYLARTISSMVTIYGKDQAVRKGERTVTGLELRVKELAAENARLRLKDAYPVDQPDYAYHHRNPSVSS